MRELSNAEMSAVAGGMANEYTQMIADIVFFPVALVAGGIEWLWNKIF